MADLLNEVTSKEFGRKSFLKGGGALVVGFSLAGAGAAGKAAGAGPISAGNLPDAAQVDSWIRINADNTVNLKTSQIETGNGITTGFLMVLAEELDMDMSQMIYGSSTHTLGEGGLNSVVDTNVTLSTGGQGGSNAMSGQGGKIRAAGVVARQTLLGLAATQLGVPASSLTVSKGVVSGGGKTVTYGQLVGGKLLSATIPTAASNIAAGTNGSKTVSQYKLVTSRAPRIDIPSKVHGTYTYIHALRIPGMLHGRWIRPRGQGPYMSDGWAKPLKVDTTGITHLKGVKVIQVGDFVGVVAEREYDVVQAAAQIKVTGADSPILPSHTDVQSQWRKADSAGQIPARITSNVGNFDTAFAGAAKQVSASFYAGARGHNPIGPGCAVGIYTKGSGGASTDKITVYNNTQNVESEAQNLATTFGVPLTNVQVVFYEGSSTYGNGYHAFDIAQAAALLSREAGAPVRLQLMRWDEQGWTKYGQAFMTDIRGGVDAKGNIVALEATQFTQPSTSLFATAQMMGNTPPALGTGSPNTENIGPFYNVAQNTAGNMGYRVIAKTIGQSLGIFQCGTLRAPSGPQTAFATEQFVDMLAESAGMDPLAFRVQNIRQDGEFPRWAAALQTAVASSPYKAHIPASLASSQTGNIATGWGMAIGTHNAAYAATVAKVQVNKKTGKITITDLWAAQDSGLAINPGLIENQMLGSLMQGASAALIEELRFDTHRVTSTDWVTYPIMRFKDAPKIHLSVIQRTEKLSEGSGEPPLVPVVPAIANAVYDALGIRMFKAPMTPAYVRGRIAQGK